MKTSKRVQDVMTQDLSETERRLTQRFSYSGRAVCETSADATTQNPQETSQTNRFEAQIENVSKGGIGLWTKKVLKRTEIIKIGIPVSTSETAIPTLAEVQWVNEESNKNAYQAGLRFIL